MPCNDGGFPDINYERNRADANKTRLDKITRYLCGVLTQLENEGILDSYLESNPELPVWWQNHKNEDQIRKIKEAEEKERKLKHLKEKISSQLKDMKLSEEELLNLIKDVKVDK